MYIFQLLGEKQIDWKKKLILNIDIYFFSKQCEQLVLFSKCLSFFEEKNICFSDESKYKKNVIYQLIRIFLAKNGNLELNIFNVLKTK